MWAAIVVIVIFLFLAWRAIMETHMEHGVAVAIVALTYVAIGSAAVFIVSTVIYAIKDGVAKERKRDEEVKELERQNKQLLKKLVDQGEAEDKELAELRQMVRLEDDRHEDA